MLDNKEMERYNKFVKYGCEKVLKALLP